MTKGIVHLASLALFVLLTFHFAYARAGFSEWALSTPIEDVSLGCNDSMPVDGPCVVLYDKDHAFISNITYAFFSGASVFGQTRDGKWFRLSKAKDLALYNSKAELDQHESETLVWISVYRIVAATFIFLFPLIIFCLYKLKRKTLPSSSTVVCLGSSVLLFGGALLAGIDSLIPLIMTTIVNLPFLAIALIFFIPVSLGFARIFRSKVVSGSRLDLACQLAIQSGALLILSYVIFSSNLYLCPLGNIIGG